MSAAVQHTYEYARPSSVADGRLRLATSPAPNDESAEPFVRARVAQPRAVALALRLVSDVVRSRHHIPAGALERILFMADPVLTWGGDVLRVEGFSSCCGIYVRADIGQSALDPRTARPGTTNVDFNDGMRAALGRVRDGDAVDLAVGADGVEVTHDARGDVETVVERKVSLPLRWLRGFVEVQAIQARMQPRLELDRAGAVRFLRGLPSSARASDAAWIVPSGRSARLGSTARDGAVRVAGMSRLRALEPGLPLAHRVVVHADPVTGASAWRLDGDAVALTVVISPETWRGFSGEGQVLDRLAAGEEPALARVRASLTWQSELTAERVSAQTAVDANAAGRALAWLATRGLVGFDLARDAWFHRVLPFDLDEARALLDAQHPRLAAAKRLVDDDAVSLRASQGHVEATVAGDDVEHRVRLGPDGDRCTCPWYAKHQGDRGPCKHVLAVELALAAQGAP